MEPKAVVNLRKGEGRTIKAGGLWIFDNEIESVMGSVEDGDIVIVRDFIPRIIDYRFHVFHMYLGCFLVCFYFFPMVSQSDLFLNPYFLFLYLFLHWSFFASPTLPIGAIS